MKPPDIKELTIQIERAEGLIGIGEWSNALTILDDLINRSKDNPKCAPTCIRALLLHGFCNSELSELGLAEDDFRTAIKLADETIDPKLQGEARVRLANILWKVGKKEEALKNLDGATVYIDRTKDARLDGLMHLEKGTILMLTEDPKVIDKEYREAILALERAGDLRELARAYNNFATNYLYKEDWKKAAELFGRCKTIAKKAGYIPLVAWGGFNKAGCLSELGMQTEALNELDAAYKELERTKDLFGLQGSQEIYGLIFARLKDWSKSEEHFLIARTLAKKCKMPFADGKVLYNMARMYKWRGDKVKAVRFFKEAKAIFEGLKADSEVLLIDKALKDLI
jgi:tetratricopeptide (TPR) repeat protein